MADYTQGIKKEVAEVKFLIHDLRVERFINEVIHFHVTLNTDLEIYSVEQAQIMHGEDLEVLKAKAIGLRKAFQDYSSAVRSFSPDRTVLLTGRRYIDEIRGICALILNPLWGRSDKVLDFLPVDSRSGRSRDHYRNCIHWIAGVSRRIEHFLEQERNPETSHDFDLGAELQEFTRSVAQPYVAEKGDAAVELRLDRLDSARVRGNQPRFRRMYFNLVMNAADAMAGRSGGVIEVSDKVEGDRVVLRVCDNGSGMPVEKVQQLLSDKETLDGELHSLGFVFVRQTVAELGGELSIDSTVGEGTTVTVDLPLLLDRGAPAATPPERTEAPLLAAAAAPPLETMSPRGGGESAAPEPPARGEGGHARCGRTLYDDYEESQAQFPGSIFAISVTDEGAIDFLAHRPYERYWSMNHEDLAPTYYAATFRGRLEEDEVKRPLLTLKEPQSVKEYFDLKELPETERSAEKHIAMVHDEYIRIARMLIETGFPPQTGVQMTGLPKFFPGQQELSDDEPFPLSLLASRALTTEEGG